MQIFINQINNIQIISIHQKINKKKHHYFMQDI